VAPEKKKGIPKAEKKKTEKGKKRQNASPASSRGQKKKARRATKKWEKTRPVRKERGMPRRVQSWLGTPTKSKPKKKVRLGTAKKGPSR